MPTREDLALDKIARRRERTFSRSRALSHREIWQRTGKPRAAALARRGLITLPRRSPDLGTRPIAIKGEPISRTIIRDRRGK